MPQKVPSTLTLRELVQQMKWTSGINFTGKNDAAWKARIRMMLQAIGLWTIVTLDKMPHPRDAGLVEE
ncbi:hypothetical protein F441_01849 [Phytophthora nicotianae CJ01A1]|uniref:Uncharacterized protein n=4 Tax=Phytophthora nicotianae TaxID=4792 RepID=V9FXI1_PHYNI|nr:hypothetical protein F443_01888 [Phytophthora nicotianae P1569]ETL48648.1 hypothetical protein L916_01777 [Phytophthora nicotianae]ETP25268.1 hypothetical protein F441_01849 [Phytophthora nicotianae CJ01A1]ETP53317.1 hypothetical protein F442_01827 [Phytophthora nicotianae P10297]ETM01710.1 hypothetical protein L917_01739 [Phytophthora nicotianae]